MKWNQLEHSKIYRGPASTESLSLETENVFFEIRYDSTVRFGFNLSSKGGGYSAVRLDIGLDDLPAVLSAIAKELPETAGIFADCTVVATKKNLKMLEES